MRRFSLLICFLFFILFLSVFVSAEYYVRSTAIGNNDGSDWINAFTNLPDELIRGEIYYISDGIYLPYTFDDSISDELYITIKKAIESDHGTDVGWIIDYGDGQAIFEAEVGSPILNFYSSYYIFDGQIGSGKEDLSYGIKLITNEEDLSAGSFGINIRFQTNQISPSHINISYVNIQGAGIDVGSYPECSNKNIYIYGENNSNPIHNISLTNSYLHDASSVNVLQSHTKDVIYDNNYFYKLRHPECHNEVFAFHPSSNNITISNNVFEDISGTGIIVFGLLNNGIYDNIDIYNNIFFSDGTNYDISGVVTETNDPIITNLKFYHNTMYKIRSLANYVWIVGVNEFCSDIYAYNNILYDVRGVYAHIFDSEVTHDYNLCYNLTKEGCEDRYMEQVVEEPNGIIALQDPLVNPEMEVFNLVNNSVAIDSALNLNYPYNYDIYGTFRPQENSYDIGAIEFIDENNINDNNVSDDCVGSCASSLTQYGITWTFDKEYNYGQFVNGDYYVLDDGSGVNIIDIDPASVEYEDEVINGAMINPEGGTNTHGFDERARIGYDPNLNVAYAIDEINPLILSSGDSLISSISDFDLVQDGRRTMAYAAILTVVNIEPNPKSFRPPFVNTDKTMDYTYDDINFNLLKNLSPMPGMPEWDVIEEIMLAPFTDYVYGYWTEDIIPTLDGLTDSGYGRDTEHHIGNALLMINTNATIEEKEKTVIGLIQRGIDLWGVYRNARIENERTFPWHPDGGIKQGRKVPILLAGVFLDDFNMKNVGFLDDKFHEDAQIFYVSKEDVNRTKLNIISDDPITFVNAFGDGLFDEMVTNGYLEINGTVTKKLLSDSPSSPLIDMSSIDQATKISLYREIRYYSDNLWWPDYRSDDFIGYDESYIGVPEWGIRHTINPYIDTAYWSTAYRQCCNPINGYGSALGILVMDLKELYNCDGYFDYQYRYYEIESLRDDPFGTSPLGIPDSIQWTRGPFGIHGSWMLDMFEEYWDDYYSMDSWNEKFNSTSIFHDSDTNQNGEIEITELNVYIQTWRTSNTVSLANLIEAIKLWKQ